jgi:excinuclease ABC subunit B
MLIIDESHVTVPQVRGMFRGDQARKKTLVDFGFRLPSALDNRPLNIDEFWERAGQTVFVSATPGDFELEQGQGLVVELVNRPTGLLDPETIIRPATNQIDDLLNEIRKTVEQGDRVLAVTLTKKTAESLSSYLQDIGIRSKYLHSDINAIERVEILRGLRKGDFDVLIGINLLREGLDLVEVSLVAILDADKEGFLRSTRSLIQIMGRAARNIRGRAILYADKITDSIREAIEETERRREIQAQFNKEHGITPRSARSSLQALLGNELESESITGSLLLKNIGIEIPKSRDEQDKLINELRKQMWEAADKKEFERAAELRDAVNALQEALLAL